MVATATVVVRRLQGHGEAMVAPAAVAAAVAAVAATEAGLVAVVAVVPVAVAVQRLPGEETPLAPD